MKRAGFVLSFVFLSVMVTHGQLEKYSRSLLLMGSRFEITAVHGDAAMANRAIDGAIEEIRRIEAIISSHQDGSVTSSINAMAGVEAVRTPYWYYQFIKRTIKISKLTDGAFDISYAVMDQLWDFKSIGAKVPDPDSIEHYVNLVNYQNIVLLPDTSVFLSKKGMRIGFGAIGKGFAANRAKQVMLKHGIRDGYVDASGDVLFWGNNESGKPWGVGIASPKNKKMMLGWLEVNDMAVVTSGNYENFILSDSIRYTHILDPKTGWPSKKVSSVSIVCPDAELADALATSVMVLGPEKGLRLVDALTGVESLIVTDNGRIIRSKNLMWNQKSGD